MIRPLAQPYEEMPHVYRGGARLARFRGAPAPTGERAPEEWLGSAVTRFGGGEQGLSRLADGRTLVDHVRDDRASWLGRAEAPGMLAKLIDAGERLPVHVHPDRAFAARRLGSAHGKAEAWAILEAEPGAAVWLGFSRDVSADELRAWFDAQDERAMLGAMNRLEVSPGDLVFVPPGVAHAIGAGILFFEVQEPTDFSLFLEWERFVPDASVALLGLDRDVAIEAVRRERATEHDLARWHARAGSGAGLPAEADEFFRLAWLDPGERAPEGFGVLVVTAGSGALEWSRGRAPTRHGDTWVVPAALDDVRLTGDGVRGVWASA